MAAYGSVLQPVTGFFDLTVDADDGTFLLDRSSLQAAIGSILVDGSYTVEIVASDEFGQATSIPLSLHLDTQAPTGTPGFEELNRVTFSDFEVYFDDGNRFEILQRGTAKAVIPEPSAAVLYAVGMVVTWRFNRGRARGA